jgi:hypothetical protein
MHGNEKSVDTAGREESVVDDGEFPKKSTRVRSRGRDTPHVEEAASVIEGWRERPGQQRTRASRSLTAPRQTGTGRSGPCSG